MRKMRGGARPGIGGFGEIRMMGKVEGWSLTKGFRLMVMMKKKCDLQLKSHKIRER